MWIRPFWARLYTPHFILIANMTRKTRRSKPKSTYVEQESYETPSDDSDDDADLDEYDRSDDTVVYDSDKSEDEEAEGGDSESSEEEEVVPRQRTKK